MGLYQDFSDRFAKKENQNIVVDVLHSYFLRYALRRYHQPYGRLARRNWVFWDGPLLFVRVDIRIHGSQHVDRHFVRIPELRSFQVGHWKSRNNTWRNNYGNASIPTDQKYISNRKLETHVKHRNYQVVIPVHVFEHVYFHNNFFVKRRSQRGTFFNIGYFITSMSSTF